MYSWLDGFGPAQQGGIDARRFRQSLGGFTTGVCLVSAVSEAGKREGMTINSFASVSLDPPLVLWSIRDDARSVDIFLSARHFVISVLAASQRELAMHFARPTPDKFASCEAQFELGIGGCPRLREAVSTYECTTYSRHKEGDHSILLGKVERFTHSAELPALVYHAGQMGSVPELALAMQAAVPAGA
ncbi:hypothetical protein BH09PSE5_BH09PSE5_43150 [soil metagenome]